MSILSRPTKGISLPDYYSPEWNIDTKLEGTISEQMWQVAEKLRHAAIYALQNLANFAIVVARVSLSLYNKYVVQPEELKLLPAETPAPSESTIVDVQEITLDVPLNISPISEEVVEGSGVGEGANSGTPPSSDEEGGEHSISSGEHVLLGYPHIMGPLNIDQISFGPVRASNASLMGSSRCNMPNSNSRP